MSDGGLRISYFATFLRTTGLFDRLVEDAPFAYASPNAPDVRNVVGTAVLAILAGFTRYCHIERLRRVAFRKWLEGRPLDPLFDGDQMLLRLSG